MEVLKFVLLLLVPVFAQMYISLGSPLSNEEDGEIWTLENLQGYPPQRGLTIRLADLVKRSRVQQFHNLMGRSTGYPQVPQLGKKRNKGEMFVGLMGRRSLRGDMQEEWPPTYY